MNKIKNILEEKIKNLQTLKNKLEFNEGTERFEEYNIKIIETINEVIDCISLPVNKLRREFEQNLQVMKQDITEKYRFIIENVNDVISVFDKDLHLVYINDAGLRLSGFSKDELLGRRPQEFMHPDDIKGNIKIFRKALKTGAGFGEFRLRRKDGSYVWLEATVKIKNNGNGDTRAIFVSRDITERKLMEDVLKKSEEKNRLITENINDLIVILSQSFEVEYINEQVSKKIWGYNQSDLIGKSVLELIHPEDLKVAVNSLKKGYKTREGETILRVKKKDGSYSWFEIRGKGFTDDQGYNRALMICRDITERKHVEEKYRELFENSPFSIILLNQQGIIIDCNSACENLIDNKKVEIIEKRFCDLPEIPPEYRAKLIDRFKKRIKGENPPPIEIRLCKKDGNEIWINYTTSLFTLDKNILIQVIVDDITERKKAESLILEEVKKLKELDQLKTDLMTRVSHEIKTPLSLIFNATELLSEYYKEIHTNKANEIIDILMRGGHRLRLLVTKLIDASMLESGNIKLEVQRKNILEIIKNCIHEIRLFAQQRNHSISLNCKEDIFLRVNQERIEQVIMNILLNAVKNTPPNGNIYVNITKYNGYVDIIIKDNGVGFTEEEKLKLFKKFGKIERYGKEMEVDIEGSGLGLYLSKKIVELHDGKIWVESEGRNKGSAFTIRLPNIT
jgi:PAS domain S-box-containing protein